MGVGLRGGPAQSRCRTERLPRWTCWKNSLKKHPRDPHVRGALHQFAQLGQTQRPASEPTKTSMDFRKGNGLVVALVKAQRHHTPVLDKGGSQSPCDERQCLVGLLSSDEWTMYPRAKKRPQSLLTTSQSDCTPTFRALWSPSAACPLTLVYPHLLTTKPLPRKNGLLDRDQILRRNRSMAASA